MKKPDPKKQSSRGRPVKSSSPARATPHAAKKEALNKPTSFSARHVVVEVEESTEDVKNPTPEPSAVPPEDASPLVEPTSSEAETITTQNIAESITTENPSEFVSVRKNVSSLRLFFAALATGVLLGVVIFGGLVFFESYGGMLKPTPTPAAAPEPTPTEVALNLSEYKVQILNGSGTPGAAKTVGDLLEKEGFAAMTLGNAKEYGYTDTEVAVKKSVPSQVFEKIQAALPTYSVVEVTALSDDSSYDIVITVGIKKISE